MCTPVIYCGAQGELNLYYLLNKRERRQHHHLNHKYRKRFGTSPESNDDLVFFLGDNVSYCVTWSAVNNRVPTFRRNGGFYWVPSLNRFLVTADKMSCLGFPVDRESARSMGVLPLPTLEPTRGASVLGNSMHFLNASIILLIALTCFGRETDVGRDQIDWTTFSSREERLAKWPRRA